MRWLPLCLAAFLLGFSGCTQSPEPEVPAQSAPSSTVQVPLPPPPIPVAPAPKDLVALVRLTDPGGTFAGLQSFAPGGELPDLAGLLQAQLPSLDSQLDLQQPLEVAVSVNPVDPEGTPLIVASLALRDFAAAVAAMQQADPGLEQVSPSVYHFQSPLQLACVLMRANGAAPGRVLCGQSRAALDVMAPYMTATLPTQALPGSRAGRFQAVVLAEPLRRLFGQNASLLRAVVPIAMREAALGNARFDGAMSEILHSVVGEVLMLVEHVDSLVLTGDQSSPGSPLQLSASVQLRERKSWVARQLLALSTLEAGVPALSAQLPADADAVGYVRGQGDAKSAFVLVAELVAGALEHYGVGAKQVDHWGAAARAALEQPAQLVFATWDPDPAPTAKEAGRYTALGFEAGGPAWLKLLDLSAKLSSNRKLQKELSQLLVPRDIDAVVLEPVGRALSLKGLPKGSRTFRWTRTPSAGSEASHHWLVAMPQADRLWLVAGPESQGVRERALRLVERPAGAGPHPLLAGEQGAGNHAMLVHAASGPKPQSAPTAGWLVRARAGSEGPHLRLEFELSPDALKRLGESVLEVGPGLL